jgi:mannose-6-phosphate isomerase
MSLDAKPRRIEPDFRAKIWGSTELAPWFEQQAAESADGERIGEVWFPADDLLIKFLFTSENLSVQVHPDENYALRRENSRGKTEMWHVLRASPGARIALGFEQPISPDELIPAAQSGRIMELLNWIEVRPHETYFIPPGTVHAIGAGVALCEVQQNSDLTYRLFDYGRKRELHFDRARDVASFGRHPGKSIPRDLGDGLQLLVDCPYFRTYSAVAARPGQLAPRIDTRLLIVLEGAGRVNGLAACPGDVFDGGPDSHRWFVEPATPAGPMRFLLVA